MTTLWLGKLLLLGGCSALGYLRGQERRRRVACLADLRRATGALARELTFSLRPLPELAAAVQGRGPAGPFFALCRREFLRSGGESWADCWQKALDTADLPLREADAQILREMGEVLGRYDGESQRRSLEGLLARLEEALFDAREEARRLVRVDLALGVTAGLFACILL